MSSPPHKQPPLILMHNYFVLAFGSYYGLQYQYRPNNVFVSALLQCDPLGNGDAFCAKMYRPGSRCTPTKRNAAENNNEREGGGGGTCSNPFASGCLRNYLGEEKFSRMRVCNSDDDAEDAAERGECMNKNEFGYKEIRILSQDWESAIFSAWIMQIFLSELLGVPAAIENGKPGESTSFYDADMGFTYGSASYDYEALRAALDNDGDCVKFQAERKKNNETYKSCAHVLPEVWNGQKAEMAAAEKEGLIEPTSGSGAVGKLSWYIPYFTAKRDPMLLSYFGLAVGNDTDKRRKIAETFLPPHTWIDYCAKYTADNCTSPPYQDGEGRLIASGPPPDADAAVKYFVPGSYHGHFAATEEQDCNRNPFTCTGHIGNVKCSWSTFAVSQAHHLGIPVKSYGPLGRGGYSYGDMIDIYAAANYTKSDILVYWWTPEVKVQEYHGTHAEFQRVLLPSPSEECIESRVSEEQRCSDSISDNLAGEGACDTEAHSLQKLVVGNLYDITHPADKALQSPAYSAVKATKVPDLSLESMFRQWSGRRIDSNYDAREAVCAWAAENLSTLQRYSPKSFPRSIEVEQFVSSASYTALVFSFLALICVVVMFAFTWKNQKSQVFKHAQPNFLFMLLVGSTFICIASVLYSTEPNKGSCIARPWFVVLGNTLQVVPLIIKVAAINKICQQANRMMRTSIRPPMLYKATAAITLAVCAYLLIWTLVDPHTSKATQELSEDVNDEGGQIVKITFSCSSDTPAWAAISFAFQFLLLCAATVLAYQNQNAIFAFNESFFLAMVVYAHFLFTALLVTLWVLSDMLDIYTVYIASSFLLSLDALASLVVYFLPKVKECIMPSEGADSDVASTMVRARSVSIIRRNAKERQEGPPSNVAIAAGKTNIGSSTKVSELSMNSAVSFRLPGEENSALVDTADDQKQLSCLKKSTKENPSSSGDELKSEEGDGVYLTNRAHNLVDIEEAVEASDLESDDAAFTEFLETCGTKSD